MGFQEILGTDSIQAVDCIIYNIQSSKAVLGEISISGTLIKMDNLADALQVCLDCDAKMVESLRDPSVSYEKLGDIEKALGNPEGAKSHYEKLWKSARSLRAR